MNTELNEVTVACKAIDIPEVIDVDVSGLTLGETLTVADLNLPEGAEVVGESTQAVATVLQARKAEPARGEETAVDASVTATLGMDGGWGRIDFIILMAFNCHSRGVGKAH